MRSILRVLALFCVIAVTTAGSAFAQSGWFVQRANPARNGLTAVTALDAQPAIAVGSPLIVLRTADAGASWTIQAQDVGHGLNGVAFLDGNIGFAVGEATILRTDDGGVTWTPQASGTTVSLTAISIL